jgi:uncharacterized metal-binding protein YceD (DUF177 family)
MSRNNYFIDFTGLKLGKHDFNFEITKELFNDTPFEEELESLEAQVKVVFEKRDNIMELSAHFDAKVELICDKCGDAYPEALNFDEDIIFKYGEESESTDEIINIGPNDFKILLDDLFYQWIILHLPTQRKHPLDENGELTCSPERLERLAEILESQNKHKEEQIDERWSGLKELLTKKNNK